MATLRDIVIALRVKDNTKGLDDADRKLKKAKGSASELGKELKGLVAGLGAMAAAQQAWTAVEKAVDASAKFGQGLAQIGSLIPGQQARVGELREGIIKMAQDTGKSLADMNGGVYEVISTFGDTKDTLKITETAAKAATAGLATTTEAIGLLGGVTKAYGVETAEAVDRAADLAFMTVNLGKTNFPQLAQAMSQVAPSAAALGVTQEELFASFAALTGVTGTASQVSTQLVQVYAGLGKRTPEAAKALRQIGFTSIQAAVGQLGYVGTLRKMIATTDGSTEAMGKLFGSTEAVNAVLALTQGQAKSFDDKLLQVTRSAGATNTAFHEATSGPGKLAFEMAQAAAKMEAMEVALGDKMAPAVMKVRQGALDAKSAFIDAFINQMPSIENFGRAIFDADGQMGGMKATAEGVAQVVRLTIGGLTITFLGLKRMIQGVVGDLMSLAALAGGDSGAASAIQAQLGKDLTSTDAALAEAVAELGRSPEESRRINQERARTAAQRQFGFVNPDVQTQRVMGGAAGAAGVQETTWAGGVKSYSYGQGPFRANLPGIEGEKARAEIKQLVVNINGDKSVAQAKDIVKDGVAGGLEDALRTAGRLVPTEGHRLAGGNILE